MDPEGHCLQPSWPQLASGPSQVIRSPRESKGGLGIVLRSVKMIRFSYLNRRYQDKGRRRVKIGAACILIRDATRQARHHATLRGHATTLPPFLPSFALKARTRVSHASRRRPTCYTRASPRSFSQLASPRSCSQESTCRHESTCPERVHALFFLAYESTRPITGIYLPDMNHTSRASPRST